MNAHPAQERLRAYLRRKGTEAAPERVRDRVASTLGQLEGLLAGIDSERATAKPDPDRWCVQEVVNHLALSLEPAIVEIHSVVDGTAPGAPIPAGLLDPDAMAPTWRQSVERLASAHAHFLAALDRAVENDPPLDRKLPALMLIQVEDGAGGRVPLEWVERVDWKSFALVAHVHTHEHIDQIRRILEPSDPV